VSSVLHSISAKLLDLVPHYESIQRLHIYSYIFNKPEGKLKKQVCSTRYLSRFGHLLLYSHDALYVLNLYQGRVLSGWKGWGDLL
jgi:hypothetical protein